ncbi:hypothetical protein LXA43DRAFT_1008968, partial [Ganoderma leucocontextum]
MFGFVLSLLGFTAAGVAKGSIAAWVQSVFYGASTTGLFSTLQSAGATRPRTRIRPLDPNASRRRDKCVDLVPHGV